ncbi:hypothetical protein [Heyndrickxia camelliae]|uniref:Uncharacterized protein n=1 Tax=Heyndrickxia camelliae TaxID=1707093 RepID=A0A2N3LNM4_9BACI|nr:hypothetical protein [Heyndrickxia camelliae]PKR86113.1 hypothetical protein CWO92_07000 [Heyndrickxia camelliae]
MTKTEKLSQLYKKANSLNEDLPKELMDKLSLYGQVLEIIGGLHAESVGVWKIAEAKRREILATVYSLDPEGSNKDRENKAEMAAAESRREEALAEKEATRWKNAYTSTLEMINILKKKYDHMKEIAKGGI